jgi:hypothetical protein
LGLEEQPKQPKEVHARRLTRAKDWETLWTLGMRGDGDTASPTLDSKSLVDVINYQQSIMKTTLGTQDLSKVPQMWCVYKVDFIDSGATLLLIPSRRLVATTRLG